MKRIVIVFVVAMIVAIAYYLATSYRCDRFKNNPITQAPIECIEKLLKGMKR